MFTGIVKGLLKVHAVHHSPGMVHLEISFPPQFLENLAIGASVAINGVCLTVVSIQGTIVRFDMIQETLDRTNLADLSPGDLVNVERSARFGDEIGGHLLSGHILGQAAIERIENPANNHIVTFKAPPAAIDYLFPKGYIALDGVSLTLVTVDRANETFSVHLIPETLRQTTFGFKKEGSKINVEVDTQTQTIVDTIKALSLPLTVF